MTRPDLANLPDRAVLALLLFGESRGEPVQGQIAVACVVRNRVQVIRKTKASAWKIVMLDANQFSCFNPDDPNLPPLLALAGLITQRYEPPRELAQEFWIADGVISGAVRDNTRAATHYLSTELLQSEHPPAWAINQPILAAIGSQSFLKLG